MFKAKLIKKGKWGLDKDIGKIWNEMASCIKRVGKEVLGESKGWAIDLAELLVN